MSFGYYHANLLAGHYPMIFGLIRFKMADVVLFQVDTQPMATFIEPTGQLWTCNQINRDEWTVKLGLDEGEAF